MSAVHIVPIRQHVFDCLMRLGPFLGQQIDIMHDTAILFRPLNMKFPIAIAKRIKDHVDPIVASARLTAWQKAQKQRSARWTRSYEGKVLPVLVEGPSRHDEGVVCGRTSSHLMVNFPGDLSLVGQTIPVRVTRGFAHSARGERA